MKDAKDKNLIDRVEGGWVLRYEETLVPLLSLARMLQLDEVPIEENPAPSIVVVRSKELCYGIIVDSILDIEDTVVKRLSKAVRCFERFSGATFLGDGHVGLILDVEQLAELGGMTRGSRKRLKSQSSFAQKDATQNTALRYLFFYLSQPGLFGLPLHEVHRLEFISSKKIEYSGKQPVIHYRDQVMPLFSLDHLLAPNSESAPGISAKNPEAEIPVLVIHHQNRFIGLCLREILDIAESSAAVDSGPVSRPGIRGMMIHQDHTITVLRIETLVAQCLDQITSTKAA